MRHSSILYRHVPGAQPKKKRESEKEELIIWARRRNWHTHWVPTSAELDSAHIFDSSATVNCTRSVSRSLPSSRKHSIAGRPKQKKWRKKSINWRRKNVMEKWDFINLWWWQRRRKQHQSSRVWALSEWKKQRFDWCIGTNGIRIGFYSFFLFFFACSLVKIMAGGGGHEWRRRRWPRLQLSSQCDISETPCKKRGKTQWNRFVKRRIIYEQYKMNSKCLCECISRYT